MTASPALTAPATRGGDLLRVLHVILRLPGSGTERQLAGMLRAAHGQLWDATLCVAHAGYPLAAELAREGLPVVELPHLPSDLHRLAALRRIARSGRWDVVHASLWGGNVAGRVAAAGPSRPAVVVSERRVEDFRGRSRRVLDRALRPLADRYVGNSQAVGEFISRAHGVPASRVAVIPNGIDRDVFFPSPAPRPRGATARLGALGRLVPQKGFDVLLAALPTILAHHRVELVVAGDGEERERLRDLADGLPVTFAGFLASPAAVGRFLRQLDLFVMPSRYEGLPNAVLEALACGVPAVATDVPGMDEALPGRVGLVPADDPAALAAAVVAALDAPPRPVDAPVSSFEDVARGHLQAFLDARAHRTGRTEP